MQYIAGHLSKIHGLDWNPESEYHLATSSQDCLVKVRAIPFKYIGEGRRGNPKISEKLLDTILILINA